MENIKFKEEEFFEDQALGDGNIVSKATLKNIDEELNTVSFDPRLKEETKRHFQTAEELLKDKKYQAAADAYARSIKVHPTMSAYLNQGNALYDTAQLTATSGSYTAGLALSQKVSAKGFELAFLNILAVLSQTESNFDEALRYYQAALKILRENGRKNDEANQLLKIGFTYTLKNDLNKAVNYYQAALKICQEVGYKENEAKCLNNLGLLYVNQNEQDKALPCFKNALAIYKELGYKKEEAYQLGNIGSVYRDKEDRNNALKYYTEALELFRQINNKHGIANQLSNLGYIYAVQGKPRSALRYFKDAVVIFKEIGATKQAELTQKNIDLLSARI